MPLIKFAFGVRKIEKNCIVYSEGAFIGFLMEGDDMRSIEEQMKEILRRKEYYLAVRQVNRLAALSKAIGLLLIAALLLAPGITGTVAQPQVSALGATILGPEAGGYVIVALLAFALGIVITRMTQQRGKAKEIKGNKI